MRTREEQIQVFVEANQDSICHEDYTPNDLRMMLNAAIQEAEQRVRAGVARDSERLDWLLAHSHYGIPGFDPVVSGRTPEKRRADLIRAIDAAREVG